MSNSVNKVILIGRLGKDPEARYTTGGSAVANFSVATDESYKSKDGEKVKKTEWHNIVVWGAAVENFVVPYLHKGDMVYIEGKLQTRKWQDKSGADKYTTEINVTDIRGLITGDPTSPAKSLDKSAAGNAAARPRAAAPREPGDEDFAF